MDARYYTKRMLIDADSQTYISFIFLDTSPCISYYRSSSPSHWDPCGTDYPSCSLTSTDDDFEGKCQFNENILAQDCSLQNEWLKETIAEIPENDWLIIVGHHPIDEVDVEDMTSVIQNHGFSLYINGHTHTLTQYTVDNKGAYITSGAGSLVDTTEQYLKRNTNAEIGSSTHTYKAIFNAKVAGFTQHIFNDDFSQLQSNFISYTGEIIHSFAINRLGVEQK